MVKFPYHLRLIFHSILKIERRKLLSWKIIVTIDDTIVEDVQWQEPVQFSLLHVPQKMGITIEDADGKRIGSCEIDPTHIEMKVLRISLNPSNHILELSLHLETILLSNFLELGTDLHHLYQRPKVDPYFLDNINMIANEIHLLHFKEIFYPLFTSTTLFYELYSLYLNESEFPSLEKQKSHPQQSRLNRSKSFSLEHYFCRYDIIQNMFLDLFDLMLSSSSSSSSSSSHSPLTKFFRFHFTIQYPAGHLSFLTTTTSHYMFLFSQATRICFNWHQTHHPKLCRFNEEMSSIPSNLTRNTLFKDVVYYHRINPFIPGTKYVIRLYFMREIQGSSSASTSLPYSTSSHSTPSMEYKYQEVDIKCPTPFHMWLLIRDIKRCSLQKQLFTEFKGQLSQVSSSSFSGISLTTSPTKKSIFTQLPDPFYWESELLNIQDSSETMSTSSSSSPLPSPSASLSHSHSSSQEKIFHYSTVTSPLSIRSSSLFKSFHASFDCKLHLESYTQGNGDLNSSFSSSPRIHISEMRIKSDTPSDSILSVFPQSNGLSSLTFEKTLNLNSLVFLDTNSDYCRTSELLLQVQISRISGLLKPQIYDILPITYAIVKLCGLTAYKTENFQEMLTRNVIANTIFLPITTISDGITNLIEGGDMMIQLPLNGTFFISIDEKDIAQLGRSAKLQSTEDCSRGLMVFLYHGSKGTETIVGEQFIPLYKLFSKQIKTQLSKSIPIEKIFLQNEIQGESYSIESDMDIFQFLKMTIVSAHLYKIQEIEGGSDSFETEAITISTNLVAHLVTWNGKEIPLPFLWDNTLSAPIRGKEYVFSSSHGIMYADFIRITFLHSVTKSIIGISFVPLRDFTDIQGKTSSSTLETHASKTYSIIPPSQNTFEDEPGGIPPYYFQNLKLCPNSYPNPPAIGYFSVNLCRIHESVGTSQAQPLRFTCRAVLTNENTTKWPGYALASDVFQKNLTNNKKFSEEITLCPLDQYLHVEISADETPPLDSINSQPSTDSNSTTNSKTVILQNVQNTLFTESPFNIQRSTSPPPSSLSPPPHSAATPSASSAPSHQHPSATSPTLAITRQELIAKNKHLILALSKERVDMSKNLIEIPWEQVLRVVVVTPSVLSITIQVHRFSFNIFGRDVFNPKFSVELFICPCNSMKLYLLIREKLNLYTLRSQVQSFLLDVPPPHTPPHAPHAPHAPLSELESSISSLYHNSFCFVFHELILGISSTYELLENYTIDITQIDEILNGFSKNTIDALVIDMNSSIWNRLKRVTLKKFEQTTLSQMKIYLQMKKQCQLWLYLGLLITNMREILFNSTPLISYDDLRSHEKITNYITYRIKRDINQLQEMYAIKQFNHNENENGNDEKKKTRREEEKEENGITVGEIQQCRQYLESLLHSSLNSVLFDVLILLWGVDLISEDQKRPFLVACIENVINSYRLEMSNLFSRYFNSYGKLKSYQSSKQKFPSQGVIALFSLLLDHNETMLSIVKNLLTAFGLDITTTQTISFKTKGSTDSFDDSKTQGSDLLLTSLFDVESLISNLTQILLIEMKEWVVKIRLEWKKKEENELKFKCKNLPWYPVQIQASKFVTYLPEDVASALNSYLEGNNLTKFEPTSNSSIPHSEITRNIQSKLHLKVQLVYVTSFHYLVLIYQEEMLQMERKLQLLRSDLQKRVEIPPQKGKRTSLYSKIFSINEVATVESSSSLGDGYGGAGGAGGGYAEQFGVSSDVTSNEIEDECMVWYCSCVNDIWRACSHHFVRLKLSRSISKLSNSLSGMESIDEEEEYSEWDGVGIVSDEIRKIEREFSKALRAGLLVVVNSMYAHFDQLLSLPNLKKEWIDFISHGSSDQHYKNPVSKALSEIESYLVNYESWLEPVCFVLFLEICCDIFIEKYLLMLKDIFVSGLYKLPVDKNHIIEQIRLDEILIEKSFSEDVRNGREWIKPQLKGSYSKSLSRFVGGIPSGENDDSIIHEKTFPLPQIRVLLTHDFKSEHYVQIVQDFIEVAKIRPDLAQPLGNLVESIENAKYSSQVGNISAIKRVSIKLTPEQTVLREYIQLLYSFTKEIDVSSEEKYSRKTMLIRVYGSPQQERPAVIQRFSLNSHDFECDLNPKSPTRYDLEILLDQIRVIGLNPMVLLNRESPTLYLSMFVQQSLVTNTTELQLFHTTIAPLTLTLPLHYSSATSSWLIKFSHEKGGSGGNTSGDTHHLPATHLFSLSDSYSHCLLSCELWYKSLLRRKKKHLGKILCPLAGLDTNETRVMKQIDVSESFEEFKTKIEEENISLQFNIPMKLTRR